MSHLSHTRLICVIICLTRVAAASSLEYSTSCPGPTDLDHITIPMLRSLAPCRSEGLGRVRQRGNPQDRGRLPPAAGPARHPHSRGHARAQRQGGVPVEGRPEIGSHLLGAQEHPGARRPQRDRQPGHAALTPNTKDLIYGRLGMEINVLVGDVFYEIDSKAMQRSDPLCGGRCIEVSAG